MSRSVPRGRLKSQPVAEFGYDLGEDQQRGLDNPDRAKVLRVISDCPIQFYQLDAETRSKKTILQEQRDYQRHEWSVGIAYRTFDMAPDFLSNSQAVSTTLAHWGVYIKRDGKPYKIFGMNFADFDKKELIIEDVWAANTNHGPEWRRELDINDFTKLEDHRDLTMYFSEIEFVLAGKFWLLLLAFPNNSNCATGD
ncbi:hypothetical protein PFICI_09203 [Pestalotiopsis fici W106-1]|uniref:Uncharacterized protein n=1 Tax=Pestalotiopsis fici (strain W106-1 / CGMCC3.15140) TaxID=1229662 RepID=W3WZT0_PESFW|nr:uncharacterized protein PFICI_09203 [Pestalotiopsis fici W106-1]ETS79350.1 hypothetical protein PFICI_09203 [Pestalotiopsis fici W106-1]